MVIHGMHLYNVLASSLTTIVGVLLSVSVASSLTTIVGVLLSVSGQMTMFWWNKRSKSKMTSKITDIV